MSRDTGLAGVIADVQSAFEDFKARNDAKVKELRNDIDRIETKANRPGAAGSDPGRHSEHMKALGDYILRGDESGLRSIRAAVTTTSDPGGGYAVPEEMDREISRLLADASPMRSVSTVVPVSTSDYKKIVTTTRAGASHVTESSPRPETTSPAIASLSPAWAEIYAAPIVSQYALDDIFFDVGAWLEEEVTASFAETENADFTTGVGSGGVAKGFLAYDTTDEADGVREFGKLQYLPSGDASGFIVPTATAGPGDCLLELTYALKAAHRMGAIWMMNKATAGTVRKFRDYVTGNYLWQPGIAAGQPNLLLGYPVVENEAMPDIDGDAFPIAFGNFKAFRIVDRLGMRVLRDPFTAKPNTIVYCYRRFGSMLTDSEGIKLLKIAAA